MSVVAYLMLTLALVRLISAVVFTTLYFRRARASRFLLLVAGWVCYALSPTLYLLSPSWPLLRTMYGAFAVIGTLYLSCGGLSYFLSPHPGMLITGTAVILAGSVIGHLIGLEKALTLIHPLLQTVILGAISLAILKHRREISRVVSHSWVWLAGIVAIAVPHTIVHILNGSDIYPACQVAAICVSSMLTVFYLDLEEVISTRALQQSEARFRGIFDHSPLAISLLDSQGFILLSNQSAASATGVASPAELIGRNALELIETKERSRVYDEVDWGDNENDVATVDLRLVRSDGSIYPAVGSVAPLRDASGAFTGMVAITQDISERLRAEETRRELERIIHASPTVAFLWSAVGDGTANYISANLSQFGYDAQDFISRRMRYADIIHVEDRERVRQEALAHWESEHTSLSQRYRIVTAAGSVRWVDDTTWVHRDEEGRITAYQGLIQDITERQQLLTRIREQAAQMQQMIEAVPEGVVLLDGEHRIVLANPEAQRLLGVLAEQDPAGRILRLAQTPLEQVLESSPSQLWHTLSLSAGYYEVAASPVTDSQPAPTAWVLVLRDVTAQRQAEIQSQQQERLATLGHMAAGIAHDFNNIMAVVVLYAQMGLRRDDLPVQMVEYLNTIVQQARRASSLIQQILDFSRRSVLERGPMHVAPFLSEQVQILRTMLPEIISVHYSCEALDPVVDADPTRIQQVVLNLAINARDAMPNGGTLDIVLRELNVQAGSPKHTEGLAPGPWVEVTFHDSGSGIPESVLSHLFHPFYTTKAPGQGSGLGLAQVWGIVTQHDGNVTVTSSESDGTTFAIYLPALPATRMDTPLPLAPSLVQGAGQSLLVVEDDASTREALVETLRSLNYRVHSAKNGIEALATLEASGDMIALVLSDAVMPRMGGVALLRAMKPDYPHIRFILLTGHPLGEELANLREHGMDAWLLKPIDLARLSHAIAELLRDR